MIFVELVARWNALVAAEQTMLDDPTQRSRDRVQALGMRFCEQWKARGEDIAAMVGGCPHAFPFFHAPVRKGERPDPRSYQYARLVMPVLVAVEDVLA